MCGCRGVEANVVQPGDTAGCLVIHNSEVRASPVKIFLLGYQFCCVCCCREGRGGTVDIEDHDNGVVVPMRVWEIIFLL